LFGHVPATIIITVIAIIVASITIVVTIILVVIIVQVAITSVPVDSSFIDGRSSGTVNRYTHKIPGSYIHCRRIQ
jgi:hypothetical protein